MKIIALEEHTVDRAICAATAEIPTACSSMKIVPN